MRTIPLLALPALLLACTADSSADDPSATTNPFDDVPEVTIPPERTTPFCQIMLDLDAELLDTSDGEAGAVILDAYREALPVAPAEISADLAAVIDATERGTVATDPTTTTIATTSVPDEGFFEEGYLPADSPVTRLNAYIDFACRDVANNPGPPPTQPGGPPPSTDPS